MKNLIVIIIISLFIQSCDCMQHVSGTIIDAKTKQPITEVTVNKKGNDNDNATTNGKGEFEISSISGGLFRCPPMKIIIKKEGYETLEYKDGGMIELNKIK